MPFKGFICEVDGTETGTLQRAGSAVLPETGSEAALLALFAGGLGAIGAGTVLVRRRTGA